MNSSEQVKAAEAQADHGVSSSQPMSAKLMASNFPISFISIGPWKKKSRYTTELTAKFYFARRTLVWEISEEVVKYKMEIQWSEISAIGAIFKDREAGVLELELNKPPAFSRDIERAPQVHAEWERCSDFTPGGAASTCRRHYLKFPAGTLERNYYMLLQRDNRLLKLSRTPFPTLGQPYFNSISNGFPMLVDPLQSVPAAASEDEVSQLQNQFKLSQPVVPCYDHHLQSFQLTTIPFCNIPNHSTSAHQGDVIATNSRIQSAGKENGGI
ncbi:uncharacterized protein LOC131158575 [Malania oleifera]|uniref:uncharacterized protein LOC131158575 n=1 Tax=Malania oleifera TaxID=397392 RepID=UPI0025ADB3F4|nr:uncharacterized protein LOC131158575 [Malania oleifera]